MVPLLRVGTVGWGDPAEKSAELEDSFSESNYFPDDLPVDWRVSYISNEIDAVAILPAVIESVDADTVEEWEDDTLERFEFYLLPPDNLSDRDVELWLMQQQPKLELLGERWCGLLYRVSNIEINSLKLEIMAVRRGSEVEQSAAIINATDELTPNIMRQIIEHLKSLNIDLILFYPSRGLDANLSTATTISSLLG
ncbi:MAG: hypothetical protein HOH97_03805 [Thiotrichales bacterium]|jgi:hypothetical protein|nr:hypothetical protein [Thiotrichales bacterium]MBT3613760.1 hypothetical protein [Thiotrichales bacterium]MBT3837680.1 hypothetical protein [Thiotrichales bacterium]MBT4573753.1 hypothetical protein [Thiotrichales bacterium]MBT5291940.1 hypothetical protein [Thiotrichales bacterium]